ncbi:MFS transporter [Kitasatospora viridis]|uniref:DHA2 family methylenomycin A resistance protein-like MFS transporter n=1 Tax=Kitasatospora viridis TaxID=281105 RepID=A0A561UCR9_9ACTN|nr:MFS transporter [Kitasatospora viridis]TWF97146.1 DHA2 family methylenomycin A resistance protein-like MFS transporter [Kitasatospora viridis]
MKATLPTGTPSGTGTAAPRPARRRGLGLAGMCLGTGLIITEASVVNVAVPTIRLELHADAATGLWVVDAYALVLASLLLSAGRLGDRIGARSGYLLGLAVFSLGSILCSAAPDATLLIAARAVQGLGAALIAPAPLTLITRTYTETVARTKAVAAWVSMGSVGFAAGPLLGGLLVESLGWRSIFLINLPIAAVAAWLIVHHVEDSPRQSVSFDLWSQLLAVTALTGLVWGCVTSSLHSWSSPTVFGPLAGGTVVLVVFVLAQHLGARRGREVLLPPSILAARPVQAGLFCGAVYNLTLYGMLIVFTFDFQDLRHYSAFRTGVAFLPLTLAATAASTLVSARAMNAFGARRCLAYGMSTSGLGLAVLGISPASAPYWLVAIGFVLFSLGMGLSAPAQTLAVMSFAPDEHRHMGSSALNTARQTGGVVGVALLGAIVSGHLATGTTAAMAVGVAGCLLALTAALRLIPPPQQS